MPATPRRNRDALADAHQANRDLRNELATAKQPLQLEIAELSAEVALLRKALAAAERRAEWLVNEKAHQRILIQSMARHIAGHLAGGKTDADGV